MPTLTIAHAQYWRGTGGGAPPPSTVRPGYPAWQAAVITFQIFLLLLLGH